MNPVRLSATPVGRACADSETCSSGMDMPMLTLLRTYNECCYNDDYTIIQILLRQETTTGQRSVSQSSSQHNDSCQNLSKNDNGDHVYFLG
ncbi:hypothetical protein DFR42_102211 [Undibacterium pigrum]|uniref:Uncharacterized protein n=1 Tax=Undibacterium pigrum TaxID=401470 RepID=A0A318J7D8_9BURK|nr:hypothetical protein DFR42_102211 [Undibacterium pigrum]